MTKNPRERALVAIENAIEEHNNNIPPPPILPSGEGGDVDEILKSVSRITDMAHDVALRQCLRAREVIEATSRESLNAIKALEETINQKRTGTHKQFSNYLEAVRSATISAEDIRESTKKAITLVRESVENISKQVLPMPEEPQSKA